MSHIPVLQKEILEYLDPKPNENFIDCTFGEGGHSFLLLSKNKPKGKVLGIDLDKRILEKKEIPRLITVNASYTELPSIVEEKGFYPISGILFDFGMSSWHIDKSRRGFSFLRNEPLDMRYNLSSDLTAWEIVNRYSEKELAEIIKRYGEEKNAMRIAKEIIKRRPVNTTFELNEVIDKAVFKKSKIYKSTRTFQALRIAVNRELENIEKGLYGAMEVVSPGGKIAAVSFHSLEDRLVKNIFKDKRFKILTKKPITASYEEKKENVRARGAKLRVIIKKTCKHYL